MVRFSVVIRLRASYSIRHCRAQRVEDARKRADDPAIHPLAKNGFAFCEERWTPGSSPGVTVVGTDESKIVSEDGALLPPRAPAAAHAGAARGRARAAS